MSDIVERLREDENWIGQALREEAAAEIERLQAALTEIIYANTVEHEKLKDIARAALERKP